VTKIKNITIFLSIYDGSQG